MEEDILSTPHISTLTSTYPPVVTATSTQITYPVMGPSASYPRVTTVPISFRVPPLYYPWAQQLLRPGLHNISLAFTGPARYPSMYGMPPNATPSTNLAYPFMQAQVRHLEWIIRLFTLAYVEIPSPVTVIALDSMDRSQIVRSPFWPQKLQHNAALLTVLRALVIEYNRFLEEFPH